MQTIFPLSRPTSHIHLWCIPVLEPRPRPRPQYDSASALPHAHCLRWTGTRGWPSTDKMAVESHRDPHSDAASGGDFIIPHDSLRQLVFSPISLQLHLNQPPNSLIFLLPTTSHPCPHNPVQKDCVNGWE